MVHWLSDTVKFGVDGEVYKRYAKM